MSPSTWSPATATIPSSTLRVACNYLDPSLYSLSSWSVKFQDTNTDSTALAFNVTVPYDGGEFKTGLKYRADDKISDYHNMTYAYKGPKVTMAQTLSTWTDPNYYGGCGTLLDPTPACGR